MQLTRSYCNNWYRQLTFNFVVQIQVVTFILCGKLVHTY